MKKASNLKKTKRSRRGGIPKGKGMFNRTYRTQGGMCARCRKVLPMNAMTRDHIRPISKGGSPDWDNIQLLCRQCNEMKDDKEMRYA